ncbi:hypothetical protein J2N86_13790 [Legionella lytica]|uniref:Uncharacterized protein n=1 Tax=Legionella lytica TaxID=96232 RepID=A0ABY4Y8D0_9GAMM|nr:hypothetical protein [Legionella lytica]USQ13727.1 hypothetical protein J2N86_13790 [Legionella lytica]
MVERISKNISLYAQKLRRILKKYRLEKSKYRYSLLDVVSRSNKIELHVIIFGIKKQILKLTPEEILYDDELLSEFSPYDVRAITYLSFQKYIKQEYSLIIEKQYLNQGETIFSIKNTQTNASLNISAKKLYQDYDSLVSLSKKDMITVISTAVQEQTFLDIEKIGML